MFFTLLSSFFFFIILNNWFGLFPGVGSILVTPQKVTAEGVAPMEHHEEKGSAAHETDAERSVAKVETAPVDGSAEAYEEAAGTESTMEHMAEEAAGAAAPGMEAKEAAEPHKIPLFRAATADLNTTVALALISVLLTQYFGFKFIGAGEHLKKYSGVVGFLEGFSEISRLLSFSFRLFGNIFAGEVMIAVVSFLLPIMTPPFFLLEVFVGFIQAVVFSMLTAVFINLAIQKHH
jgi:F-type H+-transporting ATPase subunit a